MPEYYDIINSSGFNCAAIIGCESNCCLLPQKGNPLRIEYPFSDSVISKSELDNLHNIVKKNLEDIKPKYRDRVKELVESGDFIREYTVRGKPAKTIAQNNENGVSVSCMQMYYACVFLSEPDENDIKECMIYPARFQICKNTVPPECSGCLTKNDEDKIEKALKESSV